MKKITRYILAAAVMTAAVACEQGLKDDINPVGEGKTYVFTATLEAETKATFDEASMKTLWSGDAEGNEYITVMDGTNVLDYVAGNLSTPAALATFGPAEVDATLSGTKAVAVYPKGAWTADLAGEYPKVTVTYPAVQTATVGNFDPKAPVAVAYNGNIDASQAFEFKNASALLKLAVKDGYGVKSVTVTALGENPAPLAGTIVLTLAEGGEIVVKAAEEGSSSSVKLANSDNNDLTAGVYYIPVAPAVLENGISVTLGFANDSETASITRSITLERNKVYNLGAFPYETPDVADSPLGKQYVWEMSGTQSFVDFGKTESGVIYVGNYEDMSEDIDGSDMRWVSSSKYILGEDYKLVQFDTEAGYIEWTEETQGLWGPMRSTYRLEYSDLSEDSVTLWSVDDEDELFYGIDIYSVDDECNNLPANAAVPENVIEFEYVDMSGGIGGWPM